MMPGARPDGGEAGGARMNGDGNEMKCLAQLDQAMRGKRGNAEMEQPVAKAVDSRRQYPALDGDAANAMPGT